jgi:hypothetical protein
MTVVVIGPHRSGTTFVTRCIAHDLGLEFAPEERLGLGRKYLLSCFLRDNRQFAIQAPWLTPEIHQFAEWQPTVVWVNRPHDEIRASQHRMYLPDGTILQWSYIEAQLRRLYNAPTGDILEVQQENWRLQRQRFRRWTEVAYHDYDDHPLHQDSRERYHYRQTEPGEDVTVKPNQRQYLGVY